MPTNIRWRTGRATRPTTTAAACAIELRKFHVTLEQGATQFKDDQDVFTSNKNFGNHTTPFFGEQLMLTNLAQTYGIRGNSIYSKVLLTADPFSWISVFGQFLYSRPDTTVHYSQFNTGQFVNLDTLLFFTSEFDLVNATAKQPHTSGTFGFELRPMKRLRVIEIVDDGPAAQCVVRGAESADSRAGDGCAAFGFHRPPGERITTGNRWTCCST